MLESCLLKVGLVLQKDEPRLPAQPTSPAVPLMHALATCQMDRQIHSSWHTPINGCENPVIRKS